MNTSTDTIHDKKKTSAYRSPLGISALICMFLASAAIVLTQNEVKGVLVMVFIWSFSLILTDDFAINISPLLLTSVFVTRCYDSFDTFIEYSWAAVPIFIALAVHYIRFRKKIRLGLSFFGLLFVSASLLLGGVGTISPDKYFAPMTLYYTLGLGVGLMLFYILTEPYISSEKSDPVGVLIPLYLMGMLALFCVINFYIADFQTVIETKQHVDFQSSNNLATMLMICLPIPCYFAKRNRLNIIPFVLMFLGILLTASRGGIILGTAEFIICLILFAAIDKRNRIIYLILLTVVIILILLAADDPYSVFNISADDDSSFISKVIEAVLYDEESRLKMLTRLGDDLKNNILFGNGVGFDGNSDLYSPKKGGMYWYHMWLPQIIGNLGILGILAFFSNLIIRIYLVIKRRSLFSFTVGMSYLGLFLMSQVNPGEFCPIPYAVIAVILFTSIDVFHKKKG